MALDSLVTLVDINGYLSNAHVANRILPKSLPYRCDLANRLSPTPGQSRARRFRA